MAASKKYRVVHCGSGPTGRVTLLALLNRPGVDIVGHLVWSDSKIGQDSWKIVGLDHELEIKATSDVEKLIALKPDLVTYVGNDNETGTTIKLFCKFLEAGINVSTPCLFWMVEPITARQKSAASNTTKDEHIVAIEDACEKGSSTCFVTGSDPDFSPFMGIAVLKGADEVTQIIMQELGNYAYDNVPWMQDVFGFGRAKEYPCVMSQGLFPRHAWGGTINSVAKHLDIELEEIRGFFDNQVAEKRHECIWGIVELGTVDAVRVGLEGIYKGKPLTVLEHITRAALDAVPQWPQPSGGTLSNRIRHENTVIVKGDPDYDCGFAMSKTRSGDDGGLYNTGALLVNAIPGIVNAKAGVVSDLDLPMQITRNIRVQSLN